MNASRLVFQPLDKLLPPLQSDRLALAQQLSLCRTDSSGWHRWAALARAVQAFAAGHLVSGVLLLSIGAYVLAWLMG